MRNRLKSRVLALAAMAGLLFGPAAAHPGHEAPLAADGATAPLSAVDEDPALPPAPFGNLWPLVIAALLGLGFATQAGRRS